MEAGRGQPDLINNQYLKTEDFKKRDDKAIGDTSDSAHHRTDKLNLSVFYKNPLTFQSQGSESVFAKTQAPKWVKRP